MVIGGKFRRAVESASDRVVAAAGSTRKAMGILGAAVLAALVIAGAALVMAFRVRKAAAA